MKSSIQYRFSQVLGVDLEKQMPGYANKDVTLRFITGVMECALLAMCDQRSPFC